MDSPEAELHRLHHNLWSGLKELRRIRTLYDEKIAFNFDSLRLFRVDENQVSAILAFFLNPCETHGQRASFLNEFLEYFDIANAPSSADTDVVVVRENHTEEDRRIDIVVEFRRDNALLFAIGIENKIYLWTPDGNLQLHDYAKELGNRANGNFVLFYLTPDGHEPPRDSIHPSEITKLDLKFRCISYTGEHGMISLLSRFEQVCLADNVRAFIRQFQQHLRHGYLGVTDMGEQDYITGFVRKNPEMLQYIPAIGQAAASLRKEYLNRFWNQLRELLKPNITLEGPRQDTRSCDYLIVRCDELSLEEPIDELRLCHEANEFSLGLRLGQAWNNLSDDGKHRVNSLGSKLRERSDELPQATPDWNQLRYRVALPYYDIHTEELLCKAIQGKDGDSLQSVATKAAGVIRAYVKVLTEVRRNTFLAQ